MVKASVMAALFAVSFIALWPALRQRETSPGLRIISPALILLTIDFLHYLPVFGARKGLWGMPVPTAYPNYTSLFALIYTLPLPYVLTTTLLAASRPSI